MRNPNYPPEISTKVLIVNFTITKEGLEDKLLVFCVAREEPEAEDLR
jgi:dynein heavy chain